MNINSKYRGIIAEFYKHTIGVEYDRFDRNFFSGGGHGGFGMQFLGENSKAHTAVVKEALMENKSRFLISI